MGWMTTVQFLAGTGIFSLQQHSHQLWGPLSLLSNWYQGLSEWSMKLSPTSNVEVKNTWSFSFTPLIRLHGMVLRSRDYFAFYLCWWRNYLCPCLQWQLLSAYNHLPYAL